MKSTENRPLLDLTLSMTSCGPPHFNGIVCEHRGLHVYTLSMCLLPLMGDSGENKMALWSQVPHFDYMDIHPHF